MTSPAGELTSSLGPPKLDPLLLGVERAVGRPTASAIGILGYADDAIIVTAVLALGRPPRRVAGGSLGIDGGFAVLVKVTGLDKPPSSAWRRRRGQPAAGSVSRASRSAIIWVSRLVFSRRTICGQSVSRPAGSRVASG
ncbi:hypothetical protein GCM10022224_091160 [Nonomuraea antimicrobica]|uniref:DUF1232 domain-containing protein n=1 Tax=Nonomuraea antimicrobica TaxID=561173 RepID=A0ABP7DXI4_9ACTN